MHHSVPDEAEEAQGRNRDVDQPEPNQEEHQIIENPENDHVQASGSEYASVEESLQDAPDDDVGKNTGNDLAMHVEEEARVYESI